MALSGLTIFEYRPNNGSDNNGGGWVRGSSGIDYSQQNTPQYGLTNLTSSGSGATLLSGSAAADMVGNIGNCLSGTNVTTGLYQIVSVVVGVSITFDRNIATGVAASAAVNIGGARQTLGACNSTMAAAMGAWIKAEATIPVSANLSWTFNATGFAWVEGYFTTRGDHGQVIMQANSGTNYTIFTVANNGGNQTTYFRNFLLDCNNKTGVVGFVMTGGGTVGQNITVINQVAGICFSVNNNGATAGTLIDCVAHSCDNVVGFDSISANLQSLYLRCVATGLTATAGASIPFRANEGNFIECISANNPGVTSDGFFYNSSGRTILFYGCVAYKNGRDGFRFPGSLPSYPVIIQNCVAYGNGGWGINNPSTALNPNAGTFSFNALGANTSGAVNGVFLDTASCQTLTADPFVNGVSNDFRPNTTAGGGLLLRAMGFPGALPTGGTGYKDIGALQHQDAASSTVIAVNRTCFLGEP